MIRILGIRVDQVNMEESLAAIEDFIAAFRAGKKKSAQIVTINPEGIWLAQKDIFLRQIIEEAALITPDGNGVLWAASKQGSPLEQRVTGIDLAQKLCALAANNGWSVYLLGGQEGVAAQAAGKLIEAYPGLQIVGVENGYFKSQEMEVVEDIATKKTDILFAALGMPFQEKWLYQHKNELNCGVMIGVGGSFDVISGKVRRAPKIIQHLRMEWLWRLLADPKRWRRYLIIPKFMRAVKIKMDKK